MFKFNNREPDQLTHLPIQDLPVYHYFIYTLNHYMDLTYDFVHDAFHTVPLNVVKHVLNALMSNECFDLTNLSSCF